MTSVSATVSRTVDRLLPALRPSSDDAVFRLRFMVIVAWLACVVSAVTSIIALSIFPSTAIMTAVAGGVYATIGVGLRAGLSARRAFWLVFATTWLLFVLVPLGEGGPDLALVAWCAIFPIATTLFEGPRSGAVAFVLAGLCAGGMVATGALVDTTHPTVSAVSISRIATFMGTAYLLALASARMRQAALDEARSAAQARTYFLANMSHEFRTPMNGVIGLAETMLERPRAVEDHEALQLIKRSGRQLLGLIDDVIDLARMDAGRLTFKPEPTDLRRLIEDAIDLTQAGFGDKQVAVKITIADDMPARVEVDPLRLRQIVTNLVANALKFTSEGEVVVALSVAAGDALAEELVLTVSDTGVGIPRDKLEQVFAPFERVTRTQRVVGSGLGLAITRQLVSLMGGTIKLASEPNQGTRVTVRMPLVRAPIPIPRDPTRREARPDAARAVLIVDDNEINLRVAIALVRRAGFVPHAATNGREALEVLKREEFVLVLMDCHMPELDGFETTRLIRAMGGRAAATPIVAVTASTLPEEHAQCLAAGMNACATKPLTLDALALVFERALSA